MISRRTIITTLCANSLVLLLALTGVARAEDSESSNPAVNDETSQNDDQGWRYDTYYLFPLTRHMPGSGLAWGAQIVLYPIAFGIDLVQWPVGAVVGLGGK